MTPPLSLCLSVFGHLSSYKFIFFSISFVYLSLLYWAVLGCGLREAVIYVLAEFVR